MDTLKKFTKDLKDKLLQCVEKGNIFTANEISANMMVSFTLIIMIIMMIICVALNEFEVFHANKTMFRISIFVSLAIQIPITCLNQYYRGDKPWMKDLLTVGLLELCGILTACLGHNVILIMGFPVAISIRYFDYKFTRKLFWISLLVYTISSAFCAYDGIINLNIYEVEPGTTLTVETTLRQAIEQANPTRAGYFLKYLVNDMIPRFMIFSVGGIASILIAKRGRELIEMQNNVSIKTSRIETELTLANGIQKGMLPCTFPAFPDFEQLDLYATNIPAKEVGGDFYDYFRIDDNHIALVIADVSGKGIGAALFMTISKIIIKNLLLSGKNPAEVMEMANHQLCENNDVGMFVTSWVGIYEISTQKLTYCNAGHNPPLIRTNGKAYYLHGKRGFVLAGLDESVYVSEEIQLGVNDEIFLFTDGVTEATNANEELYGEERLMNVLEDICTKPVKEQIDLVLEDINKFTNGVEQFDDITAMAFRVVEN